MRKTNNLFVEIFGSNWFLELQWNNLDKQQNLNKYSEQRKKLLNDIKAHI